MTPTLRVREPQELLALIPFQLGFQPNESVVLVSLREPRHQVGLVMRVDLAELALPDDGRQLARSMVSHVASDGGRDTVVVVYTDTPVPPDRDGRSPAWRAVGHFLGAAEGFLGSADVWVVSTTGYHALGCADPRCCPPGGRPITDLLSTIVGAEMVLAGAVVMPSREQLAWTPRAAQRERRSANAAANRWRRRAEEDAAAEQQTWRQEGYAVWRTALDGAATAADLGRLEVALDDIAVRDAILLSLVPGVGDLPERFLAQSASSSSSAGPDGGVGGGGAGTSTDRERRRTDQAVGRAISAIVDPRSGVPPEDDLSSAAQRVLEGVVAHGRRGRQAPALTLLALLTWWQGSTARSGAFLERAQACDPGYRLAVLLSHALEAGMPPGWVRRPQW